MLRIRKDDKVMVIAGKDKGKTGKVMRVLINENKVVVEKINLAKKAKRRTQQDQKGGFMDVEVPLHISNVMLVDKDGKRTRSGVKMLKDGTKLRVCKTTGDTL
jgi:large subunit ribosomal protein L24